MYKYKPKECSESLGNCCSRTGKTNFVLKANIKVLRVKEAKIMSLNTLLLALIGVASVAAIPGYYRHIGVNSGYGSLYGGLGYGYGSLYGGYGYGSLYGGIGGFGYGRYGYPYSGIGYGSLYGGYGLGGLYGGIGYGSMYGGYGLGSLYGGIGYGSLYGGYGIGHRYPYFGYGYRYGIYPHKKIGYPFHHSSKKYGYGY